VNFAGEVALVLLGVAVIVVLAGVAVLLPRLVGFRRVARETSSLLDMYRQAVDAERHQLAATEAEREELLRPVRRIRRIALHPLTIALFESYRRRRMRATAGA
jgi:biopolymer transport protein ExbB/TolQ